MSALPPCAANTAPWFRAVSELMQRGFDYEQVDRALRMHDGRAEAAALHLFKEQQQQKAQGTIVPTDSATGRSDSDRGDPAAVAVVAVNAITSAKGDSSHSQATSSSAADMETDTDTSPEGVAKVHVDDRPAGLQALAELQAQMAAMRAQQAELERRRAEEQQRAKEEHDALQRNFDNKLKEIAAATAAAAAAAPPTVAATHPAPGAAGLNAPAQSAMAQHHAEADKVQEGGAPAQATIIGGLPDLGEMRAQLAAQVQAQVAAEMESMRKSMEATNAGREAELERQRAEERRLLEVERQSIRDERDALQRDMDKLQKKSQMAEESAASASSVVGSRASAGPWDSMIVNEDVNQYTVGSVSGCTVMSLEGSLQLLSGAPPSTELITDILVAGSCYTSDLHTGIDEILPHVDRYRNRMTMLAEMQDRVAELPRLLDELTALAREQRAPVCCLLTKPPESVLLYFNPAGGVRAPYALFDSHKRQWHNGAAFLFFVSQAQLCLYIQRFLFPQADSEGGGSGDAGGRLDESLYFMFEATFLALDAKADANHAVALTNREQLQLKVQLQAIAQRLQEVNRRQQANAAARAAANHAVQAAAAARVVAEVDRAARAHDKARAYAPGASSPGHGRHGGAGGGVGQQHAWRWDNESPAFKKHNSRSSSTSSSGRGDRDEQSHGLRGFIDTALTKIGFSGKTKSAAHVGNSNGGGGGDSGGHGSGPSAWSSKGASSSSSSHHARSSHYKSKPRQPNQWAGALREFLTSFGNEGILGANFQRDWQLFHGHKHIPAQHMSEQQSARCVCFCLTQRTHF